MSFLKKLFKKEAEVERKLTHANQLKKNDIIVLSDSFGLPETLRGQEFQVSAINCYEYENKTETEWVLEGTNNTQIYLTLDIDDETYLKFSLKIERNDVETLFNLDDFATIFDEPGNAFLERQADSNSTSQWSSDQYQQQTYSQVGYFHRKDNRVESLSSYEGKDAGEQFELYALFDKEDTRGIDIEVWQDGDTEVFLTLFRPTTDIIDMYPGS
ncbi:hypothetical protein [Colwellia sp. UCD-KL20]|uniref:hypothetical protein n=1 Tax=Colwellia sp. UCD-KL20 TaxID=1917165 RepID=UPI000970AE5B|nr:hypothetical protein [Colwellia sp. UCD-KL20]